MVRQSSAKAPLPSSNLGGTSKKEAPAKQVLLFFAAPELVQYWGRQFVLYKNREAAESGLTVFTFLQGVMNNLSGCVQLLHRDLAGGGDLSHRTEGHRRTKHLAAQTADNTGGGHGHGDDGPSA